MCFSGGPRFGPGPTKCRTADTGQRSVFVIAPSWPYPTTMVSMNMSALRRSRATVIRRPPPTEISIHFSIGRIRFNGEVARRWFSTWIVQGHALMFDLHASTILTNAIDQKKTNGAPTNSQRPSLLKRMKVPITIRTQTAATPKLQKIESGVMKPRYATSTEEISNGCMVFGFLTVVSSS